jgi:hypothetical protein
VAEERFARLKEALPFLVCHQQQREGKRPMDEMVIIGMDPHKASNTIAVLDSTENFPHDRLPQR